jgi:F-type H+-transporting ATPase subunit gamma
MLRDEFMTGKYNKVVVFYSHFLNTIKQIPISKEFLPISSKDIKEYLSLIATQFYDVDKEIEKSSKNASFYKVEPSKEELAEHIIPIVLDMMFYDLLLESKASEHSSRMVAMKSAKDNAKKIADNLTLKYNKARQSIITKEVSEITA